MNRPITNLLPDITRQGVKLHVPHMSTAIIEVSSRFVGGLPRQRVAAAATWTHWANTPWPEGLICDSCLVSIDGETVLNYAQWTDENALDVFTRGQPDRQAVRYRLYRSSGSNNTTLIPGCIVIVSVEFNEPDPQRQRRWIDTVFDALAAEPAPVPGGISGHFHVSTDGTRVLNYAAWVNEAAHRSALERSGQGTVGAAPEWQRVKNFPGIKSSDYKRYYFFRSRIR